MSKSVRREITNCLAEIASHYGDVLRVFKHVDARPEYWAESVCYALAKMETESEKGRKRILEALGAE